MANIRARLPDGIQFKDRILWNDGSSSYFPDQVQNAIAKSQVTYVTKLTPDIATFNKILPKDKQIRIKSNSDSPDTSWNIPELYKTLNVRQYVLKMHRVMFRDHTSADFLKREERLHTELDLYEQTNLLPFLAAIVWFINTLTNQDIVWGVGRGSSVSSYVLYVIGVHDVDSVLYNLPIEDFIHNKG